ncbi:MAG: hypothetical protein AABX12_02270 [Nanoarchaeota archaeon]
MKKIDGSITTSPSQNFQEYLKRVKEINSCVILARKGLGEGRLNEVSCYLDDIFLKQSDLKFYVENSVVLGIMPDYYRDMSLIFSKELLAEVSGIEKDYLNAGRRAA